MGSGALSADSPFFIVGCGRSGTTLLRTLLDRHPLVAIPLESLFIIDYLRASQARPLADLLPMLVAEPEIKEWGLDVDLGAVAEASSMADAIEHLHCLYAESQGKSRWGQKTPRFVRHMELLSDHFPTACFIHLVRDPRAVVSSLVRSDVHQSNVYYASRRWLKDVGAGLRFESEHPGRVLRMSYEELVSEPEDQLREICRFVGLDWPDAGWWEDGNLPTADYSSFYDKIHRNLDGPISPDRISSWRRQLQPNEIQVIEAIVGPQMEQVGYHPIEEPAFPGFWQKAYFRLDRGLGLLRQAWKYLRQRRGYLFHLIYRKVMLGRILSFLKEANY